MRKRPPRIAPLVALLVGSGLGLADVEEATLPESVLLGVITDPDGDAVPGVVVVVSGAPCLSAVTDADGAFIFPALSPGRYTIETELLGFLPAVLPVVAGNAQTLGVELELQYATVAVDMSQPGVWPLLSTDSQLSTTLDEAEVSHLPR